MRRTLLLLGLLAAGPAGCSFPTHGQVEQELPIEVSLTPTVALPSPENVRQIVAADYRDAASQVAPRTITDPDRIKAVLAFLSQRTKGWRTDSPTTPRGPITITIHHEGGYDHFTAGNGRLQSQFAAGNCYRELTEGEEAQLLQVLGLQSP